jgi:GntR family transcriptional regulator
VSRPTRSQKDVISPADLAIDRDDEVPISVQLGWALRARIRGGEFKPGERLPGLQDLAQATGINVNTARVVYQRLEQDGLIETRQGSGSFVAAGLRQAAAVSTIAESAARKARQIGVDPREVAAALYVSAKTSGRLAEADAERRALLRTQIAALEQTLGEIEAAHPGVPAASSAPRRSTGPALLGTEQLERVRAGLVERLTVVQAAIVVPGAQRTSQTAAPPSARTSKREKTATERRRSRQRASLGTTPAESLAT